VPPHDLPADRLVRPVLGRATRAATAAAALPLVLGAVAAQRLAGRAQRAAARLPERPPAVPQRVEPATSATEAAARVLAVLPSTSATRGLARARGGFPDWPLMLAAARPELALLGYRYPRVFRHLVVPGEDAEPIAALVARQPSPAAPAVVVVHGAMTSKHFDYVRRAAVRAYRLGFHVLALDLRGFGVTALTSEAPTSLGWAEGGDVLAAGRWLRERGATSVGAVGFSLGGAAVLCAARRAGEGELDGGVLAFSPPADVGRALDALSARPPLRDPLFGTWLTLHAAATTRMRAAGYGHEPYSLREAVELVSAPWYGLGVDELARRASPATWIADVRVPVVAVHAVDDVVIPVAHARELAVRAAGNAHVHVVIRPAGGHAAFDLVDPTWTSGVERAWLGALARWPGPGGAA